MPNSQEFRVDRSMAAIQSNAKAGAGVGAGFAGQKTILGRKHIYSVRTAVHNLCLCIVREQSGEAVPANLSRYRRWSRVLMAHEQYTANDDCPPG